MKLSLRALMPGHAQDGEKKQMACGLRTCPNSLLMRIVAQGRAGIHVDQDWYCSVGCFFEAAFNRFSALAADRIVEMSHSPRLSIGLALLAKGYLTDEQLRSATVQSKMRGEELEAVLVRLGLVNEWQLTTARAAQWGVPVLGQDRVGHPVELDIPMTLLWAYSAAPLHYSAAANRLVLGFVYRVEHGLLDSLEGISGWRVEPCFITPTEFAEQMSRMTPPSDYEEVAFEDSRTPVQMAKTLASAAVDIAAREARFSHSRNLTWVRLLGKRRKIDVLFRGKIDAGVVATKNPSFLEENVGSLG